MMATPWGTAQRMLVEQLQRPFADVRRQVADALQLAVDLDHRSDEAQVAGDRLVEREDLAALLLYVDLVLVDERVGRDDATGLGGVALLDGLEGEPEVLFHQGAEPEDLAFRVCPSLSAGVPWGPRRPNQPAGDVGVGPFPDRTRDNLMRTVEYLGLMAGRAAEQEGTPRVLADG